jgi:phosphopantothenoylcysteine decarboxylase/phosphopantothenate--cysteine ligase
MPPTVVVGVGASIAAYKTALVVRDLIGRGIDVIVAPTPDSLRFVGTATWEALTGRAVRTGVFDAGGADHVELARRADLVLIAPATADLLARLRLGLGDSLLTATALAARCPVVAAPAMHSAMWENPATRDNVAALRRRGVHVVDPASGALSSGDSGVGRLADPEVIVRAALDALGAPPRDLEGRRVLITAGGTREPLDPVRFLGNSSSGRQGCELAAEARDRGAQVTLVLANVEPPLVPAGVAVVQASTAALMGEAVTERLAGADVLIMAAAVADFRPVRVAEEKIRKDPDSDAAPVLELERTPDILAGAAAAPDRPRVVVGFAAQTGDTPAVLAAGREKARRKGADLLAVNAVGGGRGFGDVSTTVHLVDGRGEQLDVISGTKREVARALLDHIGRLLATMAG